MNERIKNCMLSYYQKVKVKPYFHGFIWALVIFIITPCVVLFLYWLGDKGFVVIKTELSVGEAFGYYGSLLAFGGTVALGGLALWQNKQFKEYEKRQTDERMEKEKKDSIPVIICKIIGYSGKSSSFLVEMFNVSKNPAIIKKITEMSLFERENKLNIESNAPSIEKQALLPFENCTLRFNNSSENFKSGQRMKFRLTYLDESGNTYQNDYTMHYFDKLSGQIFMKEEVISNA